MGQVTKVTTGPSALTTEQQTTLQAIYDHFRRTGTWPTFIVIDRPFRQKHGRSTAAILQNLPESMLVPPRQGMPPISTDELRLRLQGVANCLGSSRDTRAFIEVLRWFAAKEATYEPQPGSTDDMPRVTSTEVADYMVGLTDSDPLALKRLYEMLHLDNWGIGGFGSGEEGWYVTLTSNVWRFRDVESVTDCIKAQEAWSAEQPPSPYANADAMLRLVGQVTSAASLYVDTQIVDAIRAKQGQSRFEVTKILGLVDELNDNYARRNTYSSHMLLRAVLDHVRPCLAPRTSPKS